jgi:hypothetical protein
MLLIPTVLWRDLVALLAAIVLVVSFLDGPFVQQASRAMDCSFPAPGLNASLPFAHYVPRRSRFTSFDGAFRGPTPDTVTTILSSIISPDGVENQISPSCSTGNCTFPDGDPQISQDGNLLEDISTTRSTVGMCSKCTEITTFVSRSSTSNFSDGSALYILPNGFNLTHQNRGINVATIGPATDLSWMGDMLTPELKAFSRWAYVNVTFIAIPQATGASIIATQCSLYPCLRTYTTSITNNELVQRSIRSDPMQIDLLDEPDEYVKRAVEPKNSISNQLFHYTTVKSPCRVDGKVYSSENMTSYPNGTKLALYDFSDQGYTFRNITAPEQCIYRHHALFINVISRLLNEEVFTGYCDFLKGTITCKKPSYSTGGNLGDFASGVVSRALYNNGDPGISNITRWFDKFADAMTNRFRSEYGAAEYNQTNFGDMPLGEVQGLTWQTTTCISMHVQWLLLPIILTLVTVVLAVFTMIANWGHRHSRPVWKDSLLPLIFYGHRIESREAAHIETTQAIGRSLEADADGFMEQDDRLLEASKMHSISKSIAVTFRWPNKNDIDNSVNTSVTGLQKEKGWLRQRRPREVEVDSLLQRDETSEHQRGSRYRDQLLPRS